MTTVEDVRLMAREMEVCVAVSNEVCVTPGVPAEVRFAMPPTGKLRVVLPVPFKQNEQHVSAQSRHSLIYINPSCEISGAMILWDPDGPRAMRAVRARTRAASRTRIG